jgi:hypothetical protein
MMILGVVTIFLTPTDIFPNVDIPVIAVLFNYSGMSSDDVESRIITQFERFMMTTVNDIDHVESQSLNGVGVIKIFFQKTAKIEEAMAQVTATAQTSLRQMPPGGRWATTPPIRKSPARSARQAGHRRPAPSAGGTDAGLSRRRRSHAGRPGRPHAARRGAELSWSPKMSQFVDIESRPGKGRNESPPLEGVVSGRPLEGAVNA